MHKLRNLTAAAIVLASLGLTLLVARDPVDQVRELGTSPRAALLAPLVLRYRDDVRDFPTNGFFPVILRPILQRGDCSRILATRHRALPGATPQVIVGLQSAPDPFAK